MKNTFGNSLSVTLFGESHGEAIGCVIDGISPGIEIDKEFIFSQMEKRKGVNALSTARREKDEIRILSGVFEGRTTGTPICLMIENADTKSKDYSKIKDIARPSHADYTAECKYGGYQDYRGGGHFSGRLTAPLVAAGAIALKALEAKGIKMATHIACCGGIEDREFENFEEDFSLLKKSDVPVLCEKKREEIISLIEKCRKDGDSIGGILSTAVTGMPSGVGEPWFDTAEGMLSHALFSVPAVKGVEFGAGFNLGKMRGSQANDSFYFDGETVKTKTNNNGGINGGITNGMPIIFRCAVKPTPSIYKKQETVNFKEKTNETFVIQGRHDPAIIHRAAVVIDSVTALTLCDMLLSRFGTDYFKP